MELKKAETIVGSDFEETVLGHTEGSVRQYRGPYGAHLREYPRHYKLHRDRVDPRYDPIGHLFADAPDDLAGAALGGAAAIAVGKAVYERRKSISDNAEFEAVAAAMIAGLATYGIGKWLTKALMGGDNSNG